MKRLLPLLVGLCLLLSGCGTTQASEHYLPPVDLTLAPQEGVDYAFLYTSEEEPIMEDPVRWDPCKEAIHWSYNPTDERYDALPDIEDALEQLSAYSGYTFIYEGPTTDSPSWKKETKHDLLIGWVLPKENAPDEEKASGLGGPITVEGDSGYILTAGVALNPSHDEVSRTNWRVTIFHELGHTMGLGHTTTAPDESEVMYEAAGGYYLAEQGYGAGDREGLRRLSAFSPRGCLLLEATKKQEDWDF